MASVHIGIRHQDDLIIFQFCDIKVISITFRKSAAERALIIVLISAFAASLSIDAFLPSLKIFPRIGDR